MSYDIDEFEKEATNYCVRFGHARYGPQSVASASGFNFWMSRTSRNFLPQNCDIFSVLSIFKYNPGKANNKFITSR